MAASGKKTGFLFIEFSVIYDESKDLVNAKQEITIKLMDNIDPKILPYSELYTPEKLNDIKAERFNNSLVVARGDTRDPQAIYEAGGFHPKFTSPRSIAKQTEEILDVLSHRLTAEGSGLVSFTSNMDVAKNFSVDRNGNGYVYLVKGTGFIGPTLRISEGEREYSIPGGVDSEDIIAYRKMDPVSQFDFAGSPIYVKKAFIKEYPQAVDRIIDAYLQNNECCPDRSYKLKIKETTYTEIMNKIIRVPTATAQVETKKSEEFSIKTSKTELTNSNTKKHSELHGTEVWDQKDYDREIDLLKTKRFRGG